MATIKKKVAKKTTIPKTKVVKQAESKVDKILVHYTAEYIIAPAHPVTINVIGCGGTGSQVINSLARMHSALKALGHPGLFIRAIDPDRVTEANMGRQLFSPSDVGSHKCVVLVGRINRFFGTDWEAVPKLYNGKSKITPANITISCIDTGAGRKEIKSVLLAAASHYVSTKNHYRRPEPFAVPYYWMDFGNMMDRGQVVIGTLMNISQHGKADKENSVFVCRETMPTVDFFHPDIFIDKNGEDQGPSCSLAEALRKQDLFVNTNLANMGLGLLWKMFREARLKYHGLYLNLDTLSVNPIKLS